MFPFQSLFSSSTNMSMFNYNNIESNSSQAKSNALVNKDGSYSTLFEIKGSSKTLDMGGALDMADKLRNKLSSNLKIKGFRLQFVFENNPDKSHIPLDNNVNPILNAMKKNGITAEKVINERKKRLLNVTSFERCFLCITTFPSVKRAAESQVKEDRTKKAIKSGTGIKPAEFGMSEFFELTSLHESHTAICNTISKALSEFIFLTVLSAHQALYEIRATIENMELNKKWRPSLLGDKIRATLVKDGCNNLDQSHILNADIGFQLFNKTTEDVDGNATAIKYGNKFYAPLNLDLPPQNTIPFSELFKDVDHTIPWRMSLVFESGHKEIVNKIKTKRTIANFLAITNSDNKEIRSAAEEFLELAVNETIVSCKAAFCTWADDAKTLGLRKSLLTQSIQSWGGCDVIDELGDPTQLWLNTIPAVSKKYISTPFVLTLGEAFYISPLSRPASPWPLGSSLYRTLDRKLFPVEPSSDKQLSWFDLYYAPPGCGKSFKMAADNMSYLLKSSNSMLPKLAMLDIGFSSKSFVDFMRALMPEDLKDQFIAIKLQMSKTNRDHDINPFDTPLGCRFPLTVDKEFLVNFLTTAYTPAGATSPILRLPEFLDMLIDELYKHFSDEYSPNIYQPYTIDKIDKILDEHNYDSHQFSTWYQIEDFLFDIKEYKLANLAHRLAMPTLTDITTVISASNDLKTTFKSSVAINNELLLDYVNQMTLSLINEFPILARPSALDFSNARVVSLDLSDVTPSGTAKARQKTAIIYMVGRFILCKDFYQKVDTTIPEVPLKYKEYHRERLQAEASVPKKICYDEFHQTEGSDAVRAQILNDIRVGRKYNVNISLASQQLEDFDKVMRNLADNIWILSKGKTSDDLKTICRIFEPSDDVVSLMKKDLTGPSSEGSVFLYIGNLKSSNNRVEQLLYLTISTLELWGYTTVHENYTLREWLVSKVGINETMNILVDKFENGDATEYINTLKTVIDNPDDLAKIFEVAGRNLIKEYLKLEVT